MYDYFIVAKELYPAVHAVQVLTDAGIDPAPDLETPIVGAVRAAVCAAATRLGFRVLGAHAARVLNQPFGAEGAAAPGRKEVSGMAVRLYRLSDSR